MKIVDIPYGSYQLSLAIAEDRKVTLLRPAAFAQDSCEACGDFPRASSKASFEEAVEREIIERALSDPIDSEPLCALAKGKKNVVVVTSDHTRPVPSRLTLPLMLKEIRKGSPEAEITVLIGVGSHRATTRDEMIAKFGAEFVATERIVNHDPHDPKNLVSLGLLPSGGELVINAAAAKADLLVADGFIEPHQFAGFSGGRKSILPGIAGLRAVLSSHNAQFTIHPKSRPGVLEGNPFHADMLYAARAANLAFILNVALTPEKRVYAAFAGDMDAAHRRGCDCVLQHCGVPKVSVPVIITSNGGYPLDQNLYQATKSIMTADAAFSYPSGGVIISVNECRDGYGTEEFFSSFKDAPSLAGVLAEISARSRDETRPDQWVTQLTVDVLLRRTVILVSALDSDTAKIFGMHHAASLAEALSMADDIIGDHNADIAVLPDAVSVVPSAILY